MMDLEKLFCETVEARNTDLEEKLQADTKLSEALENIVTDSAAQIELSNVIDCAEYIAEKQGFMTGYKMGLAATYGIVDNADTALSNLKTLQGLASRIAFGIDLGDPNKQLTETKLEELVALLDSLGDAMEHIRKDLFPLISGEAAV